MAKQTITALFDTRTHADEAAAQLRQAGVPAADVIVSPETARDDYAAGAPSAEKKGFWASLEDMFGGTEDHDTYAEGLRRGGTLLTAHVEDAQVDRAVDILEQHGSVDLDERETSWRSEGWTAGSSAAALATPAVDAGAMGLALSGTGTPTEVVTTETRVAALVAAAPVATQVAPVRTAARAGTDEVLQVVEERLAVSKRAVSRGKVRLHSYVVEKQVSEDITLRYETVTIDRRPVDRAVAALGADAFLERTIEAEEIDEEAVVSKSARVVEEIGIRKDAVDRVETVRDSVRSTKVDVDDMRSERGGSVDRLVSIAGSSAVPEPGKPDRDVLIASIEDWTGDRQQAMTWFSGVKIPAFSHKTAEVLLSEGKMQLLMRYVEGLKAGGYA